MQHHEAAAADIAAAGIDHRLGIAHRDRRIDRVAAGLQDGDADLGREALRRDDHAVLALDRRPRRGIGAARRQQQRQAADDPFADHALLPRRFMGRSKARNRAARQP
jgi:hypothetical protein